MVLSSNPELLVVIPHFGEIERTRSCVASCVANALPHWPMDIFIVDNSGADAVAQDSILQQQQITVKSNSRNLGFAGAVNQGFWFATQFGAQHVLILNNDIELAFGALRAFYDGVHQQPEKGIWGGILFYREAPERIWCAGGKIHSALCRTSHVHYNRKRTKRVQPYPVDYVTGACMLADVRVYEKTGGLNPDFFLYFEDSDFCRRAQKHGFQPTILPNVQAIHHVGAGKKSHFSPTYLYYQTRNRRYFFSDTASIFYRTFVGIVCLYVFTLVRSLKIWLSNPFRAGKQVRAIWSGYRDSIKNKKGPKQNNT